MTVAALLLTAGTLWLLSTTVAPSWAWALPVAVLAVCFGATALLAGRGLLREKPALGITAALCVLLVLAAGLSFLGMALTGAAVITRDVRYYERALRYGGVNVERFPPEVPEGAEDVRFSYWSGFLQGGSQLTLEFRTSEEALAECEGRFGRTAEWSGPANAREVQRYGVMSGSLPEDVLDGRLYVFQAEPHRPGDWNHGENSFAVVDGAEGRVLFQAGDW